MASDLLKSRGVRFSSVREEFQRRIALVGLPDDVLERYPFELSGGMRQRVTMVISTLLNPSLPVSYTHLPAILLSYFLGNRIGAAAARRKLLDNTVLPVGYLFQASPYPLSLIHI